MKGWKEVKILDIGRVVTGNTPPRKNPELYGQHTIFIKPTDVSEDGKYTRNPEECYSDLGYKKYKKSLIPKGATCVVTIGSIGNKITKAHCDCFINQAMNAVIPYPKFDEEFVYYLLKYNLNQLKTLDSGTASGRENVSKSSFSNIKVRVPESLPIQKQIGKTLSAYDDLIENNLLRIKLLEELAQRTYEEWFVRFRFPGFEASNINSDWLPEGWERKKLGEIANINRESIKKGFKGTIRYVDISSVSTGNIDFWTEFDFDSAPGRARRLLNHGDIIWSCVRPNRKSYSLVWNPIKNLVGSTGFAVISPRKVSSEYLYFSITTESFVGYLSNRAGGTAYPAVTSSVFEEAEIIIPSEEIDKEFSKFSKEIFDQIYLLKSQNRLLKESRDILLPRLMSGEITLSGSGFSGF